MLNVWNGFCLLCVETINRIISEFGIECHFSLYQKCYSYNGLTSPNRTPSTNVEFSDWNYICSWFDDDVRFILMMRFQWQTTWNLIHFVINVEYAIPDIDDISVFEYVQRWNRDFRYISTTTKNENIIIEIVPKPDHSTLNKYNNN